MNFTTHDHWRFFAEFCREEMAVGGPDPHMRLVGQMAQNDSASYWNTAWRGLCYCSVYNVPTGALLWETWPLERMQEEASKLPEWLRTNWGGIATRRERKSVRTPEKLARCLGSAASWTLAKIKSGQLLGWPDFEAAFEDACSIYGFGRYIGQKYVEYCRRYLKTTAAAPDIRPNDGWSPRAALALLFPQHEPALNGGNRPEELALVNQCAGEAKRRLLGDFNVEVDWYLLQVLLCDYKQCVAGKKQFPGKSQDSELEYDAKLSAYWGRRCEGMYVARKQVIDHRALGELNGWSHVRKELGYVLYDHGYMWSDRLYNYAKSRNNLSQPVRQ